MLDTNWQDFLEQYGAAFEHGRVVSFGDSREETLLVCQGESDILSDLSHLGILQVGGPDAAKLLQGQVTCDITKIDSQHCLLGALCELKGRVISTFRIISCHDEYYLVMPTSTLELTLNELQKYAAFYQVELKIASPHWRIIGLSGPNAEQLLQHHYQMTIKAGSYITFDHLSIIRLSDKQDTYWIIGDQEKLQTVWQQLTPPCQLVNNNAWNILGIQAGIPTIDHKTSGEFLPHNLNLQLINGVSFNKGCYTGQEVIARMEHRGKLKKHMYYGVYQGEDLIENGATILCNGKNVGHVVTARRGPWQEIHLLACLMDDAAASGPLQPFGETGPVLEIRSLPYSFE